MLFRSLLLEFSDPAVPALFAPDLRIVLGPQDPLELKRVESPKAVAHARTPNQCAAVVTISEGGGASLRESALAKMSVWTDFA